MIYESNYYNSSYIILAEASTSVQNTIKYFNIDGTMGQVNPEETLSFAPVALLTEQSTGGGSGLAY